MLNLITGNKKLLFLTGYVDQRGHKVQKKEETG